MTRKSKYNKDEKIKACRDYEKGKYSLPNLSAKHNIAVGLISK